MSANGASLELSGIDGKLDPIAVKVAGGTPPLNVLANGLPLPARKSARTLFYDPDGPGFVRLTVTDATGAADSAQVGKRRNFKRRYFFFARAGLAFEANSSSCFSVMDSVPRSTRVRSRASRRG